MLYATPDIDALDLAVIAEIDELQGALRYAVGTPRRWSGLLRRITFARNIRGSNTIEGHHVTVDDAVAAAEGDEPLEASERDWLAVTGYRQAMTYVLQLADDPHFRYSADVLRSLHFMMLSYDLSRNPGKWRPGWVGVTDSATGEQVYEGPDATDVPALIDELIDGLQTPPAQQHYLITAAMGHLNLVLIHPFSDGNGRMARCLQTLILARGGILAPVFSSIEEYLGHPRNTPAYYRVLGEVAGGRWSPDNDAHDWIRFCLTAHYRQAKTHLLRLQRYEQLWTVLERELGRRGLPERMMLGVWDAAVGLRVRNSTYRNAAEVSNDLASRDLRRLVEEGLLEPHGERRGRFYTATDAVRQLAATMRQPEAIPDPYEDRKIKARVHGA